LILVVDASVATKWFFVESGAQWARELAEGKDVLIAPDLIVAEVCNTAWKKVSRAEASADQARAVTVALPKIFRELVSCAALVPQALDLALELHHPAYDCFYLALAELAHADLATADTNLARKLLRTGFPRSRLRLFGEPSTG